MPWRSDIMDINKNLDILLSLVRLAIGTSDSIVIPGDFGDWESLERLAFGQGLAYVAADGLLKATEDDPTLIKGRGRKVILEWLLNVGKAEKNYAVHSAAISEICSILKDRGIEKTLLLKGLGLSVYYPVPNHRPTGDFDIYTYGKSREADKVFQELGCEGDFDPNQKHSHLEYKGIPLENHHHYLNRGRSRNETELNDYILTLSGDRLTEGGYYVPSPEKHFWFLICHMQSHLMSPESITLRHLLDWALFLKGEEANLDAGALMAKAREFRLETFASYMTSLAVKLFGLDLRQFVSITTDPSVEDRFLAEIIREKKGYTADASRRPLLLALKTMSYFKNYWKFKYAGLSFQEMFRNKARDHFRIWFRDIKAFECWK